MALPTLISLVKRLFSLPFLDLISRGLGGEGGQGEVMSLQIKGIYVGMPVMHHMIVIQPRLTKPYMTSIHRMNISKDLVNGSHRSHIGATTSIDNKFTHLASNGTSSVENFLPLSRFKGSLSCREGSSIPNSSPTSGMAKV